LAVYRTVLAWAAAQSDRFVVCLVPNVYGDPALLGRAREVPPDVEPAGIVGRILRELADPCSVVELEGRPGKDFVRAMTGHAAPARAVAGDSRPVEDVLLLAGDRTLYAAYDYGRTQILEITPGELDDLHGRLVRAGLDPGAIAPAPPYVSEPT
jgi:hypothetical protein